MKAQPGADGRADVQGSKKGKNRRSEKGEKHEGGKRTDSPGLGKFRRPGRLAVPRETASPEEGDDRTEPKEQEPEQKPRSRRIAALPRLQPPGQGKELDVQPGQAAEEDQSAKENEEH